MHQFTDGTGRKWDVSITTAEIEAIQESTGIDFGECGSFEKAFGDTKTFAAVLWCLVSEQAQERNLTPRQVKQGLDTAEIVTAARDAVAEELIRFFPKAAPLLTKLDAVCKQRAQAIETRTEAQLEKLIEQIGNGEMDRLFQPGADQEVKRVVATIQESVFGSSNSATGSAASPASILDP